MDLITKSFNRARDPPLVRNWWLNFIFDTWAGMENAAYPYSSLFLDGRPFRVVASLRRIFQQLDARRTVRQVYPGGRVVSNDPYRHPPPTERRTPCPLPCHVQLETVCIRPPPPPLDRVVVTDTTDPSLSPRTPRPFRRLNPFPPPGRPSQKGVFLSGIGFAQRALNRNLAAH